jgi:hypothetical protein
MLGKNTRKKQPDPLPVPEFYNTGSHYCPVDEKFNTA